MPSDLVVVCLFGAEKFDIALKGVPDFEASGFETHFYPNDDDLNKILAEKRPQVIVTFGDSKNYRKILRSSIEVRKRWLHFDDTKDTRIANTIMECYVGNATNNRFSKDLPLVSVITPTYKTEKKIYRPLQSLFDQTYQNWEWILFDDSPDNDATYNEMCALAKSDHRISVFKSDRQSGRIGEVKRRGFCLAKGGILIELDHDDELTESALTDVVSAFKQFPDAGFAYTDCAEVFDDGENATYGPHWGYDYGSYRAEKYKGKEYMVTNYPNVNAKTIRHIVAAPNHIRAWTKEAYFMIGGHSPEISVCDDYELCVRTFLKTRMIKVPKLCYIQYHNRNTSGNTQRTRNKEIQRLVKYFRGRYNNEIHNRFVELGVDDFIWTEHGLNWNVPNPEKDHHANYIAKV